MNVASGDDHFSQGVLVFVFRDGNVMNTLGHREHRPLEPSARLRKSHHQAFDVFQRLFSNRGGVEMPVASADRIELYTTSIIDNDIVP